MANYEVVDLKRDTLNLHVVIQHNDGRREQFGFPLGEGWEEEDSNGNLRAIKNIENRLKKREEKAASVSAINMTALKKKHKGKTISITNG